jgi:hypothetical protein
MTRRARPLRPWLLAAGALLGAALASVESSAAGNTALSLSSDPASGDWPGVSYLTPADGTFTAQKNSGNGVSVRFQGPQPNDFWWLDFAAPGRVPLTPGTYSGATRFPFQPANRPGLDVAGQGLGCNTLQGTFEILEIAYGSAGAILAFHARFEQHCESAGQALVGDVRYEAGGSVANIGPLTSIVEQARPLSFGTHAFSTDPEPPGVTAPVLPDGAAFTDAGGGRGTFLWTPGFDASGPHLARFEARSAGGEVESLTTRIEVVGVSSLWYESEPGDPIGLGGRLFATTVTGGFSATETSNILSVGYAEEAAAANLMFTAPNGAPLVPGVYEGATPYHEPNQAGLHILVGGFCAVADGRFEVKEIRRGADGEVLAFRAGFEQRCAGAPGGIRGEIRYRADVPVLVHAPERLVHMAREPMAFEVRGFAHGDRPVVLTAEALPPGARFADRGDGTGRFDWLPGALDAGRSRMIFHAADETGRADAAWTDLDVRLANDDFAGASVISALPFHDEANTLAATRASDDPSCDTYDDTVWYAYTSPIDQVLVASTEGSDYETTVSAYAGPAPFPEPLACAFGDLVLEARAGMTYFFMVNGRQGGGRLEFSVVPYRPLELGLTLEPAGRLDPRSGAITLSGTVICSHPAQVSLDLVLTPSAGRSPDRAGLTIEVDCIAATRWSASLAADGSRLHPGVAALAAEARAHDDLTGQPAAASAAETIAIEVMRPRP